MLIRFKVSNFLSFKEETEFSMVASPERIHSNHVVKGKNQPNLLRSALLYGANSAGKSNFVKAIDFAKGEVLYSGKGIVSSRERFHYRWNSFKFDKKNILQPSSFSLEFFVNEKTYEYSFKKFIQVIQEEKLIETTNGIEKILFERKTRIKSKNYSALISDTETTFKDVNLLKQPKDKKYLEFIQRSTNPDKLFLTHCASNNVIWFEDVFNWFRETLEVIFPITTDLGLGERLIENLGFKNYITELLRKSGTGISGIEVEDFEELMKNSKFLDIDVGQMEGNILKRHKYQINILHGENRFDKDEESDGTQRLFDLAFPFYDLATSETPKVYIIDELERNLHTNLSYMLLKSYLEQSGKGQLIATTHDTHLLDLDLLRRDEIWFAEKDEHGATQLYSLYDFNPRYDKDIEKDYLLGRYGAIPFLGNLEFKRKLGKNGNSKNGKEK